ncbi:hypothetical protein SAMN06265365_106168 [Tistlia consotensis]|uniref:DNA-binding beta-propeller fold protein YncE n=1 Tax=Tistlia consotensis USBA 355 TaxID=560819 RepID=A0A1Y6BCQ9_9PROT|nr:hypothetical protein [Tistlia consotensis]SMF04701.1 hypothetical protein SAMN05428998_103219 [Tistlia consotensis USBA 355]SNR54705.1 hypothetical protein SAMN06265365_106168 [Tistlia consotensis]
MATRSDRSFGLFPQTFARVIATAALVSLPPGALLGNAGAWAPLQAAGTIALPATSGRIDHLAIDLGRRRLFVAELANGTVDVVDLTDNRVIRRISGLEEPQGLAYLPVPDLLAIAGGGDGTLRLLAGGDFKRRGVVRLDGDADNVHLDPATGRLVVGHGTGGLALVDAQAAAVVADVALPAHPEGFQIAAHRAYVNLPDAGRIAVVDLDAGRSAATWATGALSSNFPMAIAEGRVAVVFRGQDRLVLFDAASGRAVASIGTCGDADDLFFDAGRRRFMVSCGAGSIEVIALDGSRLRSLGRTRTRQGARTSLFVPELDRLFVAERQGSRGVPAAIAVFRPAEAAR